MSVSTCYIMGIDLPEADPVTDSDRESSVLDLSSVETGTGIDDKGGNPISAIFLFSSLRMSLSFY